MDLEDYFHPTEVQAQVATASWDAVAPRVERSTRRILDLLDEHAVRATFFVLGWVAARRPKLVAEVAGRGHEIACHSFWHQLVYHLTPSEFRADTEDARKAIEDAGGVSPRAYRAPSDSVTAASLWALDILAELGFTHDSSVYPIVHDRYGIPGFPRHAHLRQTGGGPILEVPPATVRLSARRVAPVGGGAYLRLFPYCYTAAGIRRLNEDEGRPACIYVHPWEVDEDQPRLPLGALARLRTYTGLRGMHRKLDRLLTEFRFSSLAAVHPFPPPAQAAN